MDRPLRVTCLRGRTSDRTDGAGQGAEALDFLRAQLAIAFATDDIQEGVKAFFEKREPNWTGR